ncbi:monodechloroaminopyrrolnitrin synthase PrnB family protein [Crossiella sp. CA198]|uniref:monodechloroaminopyrrolnitrin synthase PrnB family protein n=1 Tax=Crossiella sp. CA198 TaxID=3455607 RepID=UPI003F8D09BB
MTTAADRLDHWIRTRFADLNTELEQRYFAAHTEILLGDPDIDRLKHTIVTQGATLIAELDPVTSYDLLGLVGFYLGACRRHEVGSAAELTPAHAVANRIGLALGVAPRYVFAHQSLYNLAGRAGYRTFTTLPDERIFIEYNGLAVLAYQRAATALRRIPTLGVGNPLAGYLLEDARAALLDVLRFNQSLAKELDVDRFFLNIRPYFKSYRVNGIEYRGANAGDFAAVNEIDLLLGLCRQEDPFYQHLLSEKAPYLPPEDQPLLRAALRTEPLLTAFLRESAEPMPPQLRANAELFLAVCRAHAAAYTFHHHQLVKPYLEVPAQQTPPSRQEDLTASGPPLAVVIESLARLADLRAARDRPGLTTARTRLDQLRDRCA